MGKVRDKKSRSRRCFWAALAFLLLWLQTPTLAADFQTPPAELARLRGEEGELKVVEYVGAGGVPRLGHAGVYYPAGYDEKKNYDVVILWPGMQSSWKDTLGTGYELKMDDGRTHTVLGKRLLDRLIEYQYVRPFLLVCMEDYEGTNAVTAGLDVRNMLTWLRENCAVYDKEDGLSQEEVREHYAFVGFSQGSIYAEGEGMVHLFDEFASYGAVSFGSRWEVIPETLDASPYRLKLLYALIGGQADHGAALGKRSFEVILSAKSVTEGRNAILREATDYGHDYSLLYLGLIDMLPRILPAEGQGEA